ncbi:DUF6929 family protein [Pontibacter harenae]|uniref:DUF6929 family protein n=1 Tax=Pontibacter harenae TaxID=2894083 RepID=UPI001E4DC7AA|nr:hypothetical protein [Pontibacter harenae]MCC9166726.1 hypothetical protein [Pontibacter harenae]
MRSQLIIIFILVLAFVLESCLQTNTSSSTAAMAVTPLAVIESKKFYENLPSASGIESFYSNSFYIVGDDSPYLYMLDMQYNQVSQYPLFETSDFSTGRIPKALKPDLECMSRFKYKNEDYLLLLGSGSSPARNKGFVVRMSENFEVMEIGLNRLYVFLQQILDKQGAQQLNLEGVTIDDTHVYFLQRAYGGAKNILFRAEAPSFISYLMEGGDLPATAAFYFSLPQLQYFKAGFSGAHVFHDRLFFTASVESTLNAIDDGEVLGSFIGFIPLGELSRATDPQNPFPAPTAVINDSNGQAYKGKAESLVVTRQLKRGQCEVIVVSDDDLGHSELLRVRFQDEK